MDAQVSDSQRKDELPKPELETPTVEPRVLCARAIDAALEMYGCFVVAVPEFKPDHRGGWYVTTRIDILPRPKT